MRKVEGAKVYGLCLDLLEIYDVPDRKRETVIGKLSEIAYSASILLGETVRFNFSDEGFLCIYLILKKSSAK